MKSVLVFFVTWTEMSKAFGPNFVYNIYEEILPIFKGLLNKAVICIRPSLNKTQYHTVQDAQRINQHKFILSNPKEP